MKLTLQQIDKSGIINLTAEGDITIRDFSSGGKNPLETVVGVNWASNNVMIQMDKISFIDSSGLRTIIKADARARAAGVDLVLRPGGDAVQRVFELTGALEALHFEGLAPD